ncbi:hypothetical protein HMPREF3150_03138 [Pseudomonas aeruginosa]|nr:hypothetical protein HMPREF3150_03138 [Pseudomonas aeruginosa]
MTFMPVSGLSVTYPFVLHQFRKAVSLRSRLFTVTAVMVL